MNIETSDNHDVEPSKWSHEIMYVIVYKKTLEEHHTQMLHLETYTRHLKSKGFVLETVPFSQNDNILFITIGAVDEVFLRYAKKYGIDLNFENTEYRPSYTKPFKCMATPLSFPDPKFEHYKRAPETFSGEYPSTITNAEKLMVLEKVLEKTAFGLRRNEHGVDKLESLGIISDHYALHDGPSEWTESGPLSDRQILKKYWANAKCYYKSSPSQLIEKYLGPEIAFFYSFYVFFIRTLIPVCVVSLLTFSLGVIKTLIRSEKPQEVCKSNHILCPACDFTKCKYRHLKESCSTAYVTEFVDNEFTIVFAVIMSVWATTLLVLWRRKEAIRRLQWNIREIEVDTKMRTQFEEQAFNQKLNIITEQLEPNVPKIIVCTRYMLSASACVLMVVVIIISAVGVMIYKRVFVFALLLSGTTTITHKTLHLLATLTGGLMHAILIVALEMWYDRICICLTNLENPRTQGEYDKSFIMKMYVLAFANNYSVVLYIAFVKYRFYTYPGDRNLDTILGTTLLGQICDPAGCIVDLTIHIILIMTVKKVPLIMRSLIWPQLAILFRMKIRKVHLEKNAPQWEHDYLLQKTEKYYHIDEYLELVIQYGMILFFVCAFPLAPVLALVFSIFDYRFSAYKLLTAVRRSMPTTADGIGVWNDLFQCTTYIGVAVNAFVLAFTSDFVWREVYRAAVDSTLRGFITYRLSEYKIMHFFDKHVADYKPEYNPYNLTTCYYVGHRYPPGHPQEYELKTFHYIGVTIQFLAVVIFEHATLLLAGCLIYCIPEIPHSVKEFVWTQRQKEHEIRSQALGESYHQTLKSKLAQFRTYSYLS